MDPSLMLFQLYEREILAQIEAQTELAWTLRQVQLSAPAAAPVAPRVAEGEVPGAPADRVASVPDSAFNGDLEHSLNSVFRGEDYDGKPVPLHNRGFTPDEISALQKAGLADADGKMSREQFDAWWNERGERLKPKSQRNTQSQPPAEKIAPQPVEPNVHS
jgi:hypothetical protein